MSFRFWRQIDLFGVDKASTKWFASLLERLRDLGSLTPDELLGDAGWKKRLRLHEVDWTKKNVPIRRSDLSWLPPDYRDNEADYPILQFQVSRGLGRVHGFFDEHDVFNIVLLDPLHNLQPSKNENRRIDPCGPLAGEYEELLADVEVAQRATCELGECPANAALRALPGPGSRHPVVIVRVAEDICELVRTMQANGRITSWEEVFLEGALRLEDQGSGKKNEDPQPPEAAQ
jgi:hypothetical protein